MAASRATTCCGSWRPRALSMAWPSARIGAWSRGDVENRIKELKAGLALDRLSCSRFLGNQFRLLLSAAAYILVQALRLNAAGTPCATAQATTLRERVLKVAVWVTRSVRRIVLHFPASFPWRPTWRQIASAVGATP